MVGVAPRPLRRESRCGISEIKGKIARVATSERGKRASFNDSGVNHGTQRRLMPACPAERRGQPDEKRQGRDRIDRREERRKIFADFD